MQNGLLLGLIAVLCAVFVLGGLVVWQHRDESVVHLVVFVPPLQSDGGRLDGSEAYSNELVTLESASDGVVDLSGWTLSNSHGDTFTFPIGFRLPAHARVTVHSGCGVNSETDLFWCSSHPIWEDEQDEAALRTATHEVVDKHAYDRTCPACSANEW